MFARSMALAHPAFIILFFVTTWVLPTSIEVEGVERDISTFITGMTMIAFFGWLISVSKFVSELCGKENKLRINGLFTCYIFMIIALFIYEPWVNYWDQVSVTVSQVDKITIEGAPVLIAMFLMPYIIWSAASLFVDAEELEEPLTRKLITFFQFYFLPFSIYFINKRLKSMVERYASQA